jgi:hypothetical protein
LSLADFFINTFLLTLEQGGSDDFVIVGLEQVFLLCLKPCYALGLSFGIGFSVGSSHYQARFQFARTTFGDLKQIGLGV